MVGGCPGRPRIESAPAVAQGKIAVTPVHFDLTDREGMSVLQRYDLERLVGPAAENLAEHP